MRITLLAMSAATLIAAIWPLRIEDPTKTERRPAPEPAVWRSANGAWELRQISPGEVETTWIKCELRAREDSKPRWSHAFEFAFRGVVVSDLGMVAAFGYTNPGPAIEPRGDFVVELRDAVGALEHRTAIGRCGRRASHSGSFPAIRGHVHLHHGGWDDVLLLRMDEAFVEFGSESWWLYDLLRGEFNGVVTAYPGDEFAGSKSTPRVVEMRAVPDSPLVAALWRTQFRSKIPDGSGQLLAVYDRYDLIHPIQLWRSAEDPPLADEKAPLAPSEQWGSFLESNDGPEFRLRTGSSETLTWKAVRKPDGSWTAERE